jgi:hypothetical protein
VWGRRTAVVPNPYDLAKLMFHGHFRNPVRVPPAAPARSRPAGQSIQQAVLLLGSITIIVHDGFARRRRQIRF